MYAERNDKSRPTSETRDHGVGRRYHGKRVAETGGKTEVRAYGHHEFHSRDRYNAVGKIAYLRKLYRINVCVVDEIFDIFGAFIGKHDKSYDSRDERRGLPVLPEQINRYYFQ